MTGTRLFRIAALCALVAAAVAVVPTFSGAAELSLPTGVDEELAYRMYTEQQDSSRNINRLVAGELRQFQVTRRTVTSSTAELAVNLTDKRNMKLNGTMVLVRGGDVWYFETITNRQNEVNDVLPSDPDTTPDVGVLNTMLAEQTSNSDITAKLVDGSYSKVQLGTPKRGYRSVTVPISLQGKSGTKTVRGEITLVQRSEGGRTYWYVVSFAEKK